MKQRYGVAALLILLLAGPAPGIAQVEREAVSSKDAAMAEAKRMRSFTEAYARCMKKITRDAGEEMNEKVIERADSTCRTCYNDTTQSHCNPRLDDEAPARRRGRR